MKKLLKVSSACLVLVFSSLFADTQEAQTLETPEPIENSLRYIGIQMEEQFNADGFGLFGAFLIGPSFGFGYRQQKNHNGLDLSLSYARLKGEGGFLSNAKMKDKRIEVDILYNYFFNPSPGAQFYVGLGGGISYHICEKEERSFFFDFDRLFAALLQQEYKRPKPLKTCRQFVRLESKIVLGKQYGSSFLEMQMQAGFGRTAICYEDNLFLGFALKYGMGF